VGRPLFKGVLGRVKPSHKCSLEVPTPESIEQFERAFLKRTQHANPQRGSKGGIQEACRIPLCPCFPVVILMFVKQRPRRQLRQVSVRLLIGEQPQRPLTCPRAVVKFAAEKTSKRHLENEHNQATTCRCNNEIHPPFVCMDALKLN
jgi:hypothetical protein